MKEGSVVQRLEHQSFVDPANHFSRLLAGGVEAEVHQHDEGVESDEPAAIV
jgi:hypothetical protein